MALSFGGQFQQRSNRVITQVSRVPMPMKGVNAYDPLGAMPPDFMAYAYNIYSSEQGPYTRKGFQEHATGHAAAVRTLIGYTAQAVSGANDKLFSVTENGIYDITTTTATPTLSVAFASQAGDAGWGNWVTYRNDAGTIRALYADGENGLFEYTPGGAWALVTGITGITEADIRFVCQHKLRVWVILKDSTSGYYMPVGAYLGAATEFNFGAQFGHGGYLVGLWSWTVDGGSGVDDLLVALSSTGDVVVYQGDDPSSSTTWQLVGRWNVGALPRGRNLAAELGGEFHILSRYGITALNDLMRGVDTAHVQGPNSIDRNIISPLRKDMTTRASNQGWSFLSNLSDGFLMVTRPITTSTDIPIQYVFNMATPAWGLFRDVPMQCGEDFNGSFYFGDRDGTVHKFTGSKDNVVRAGTGGDWVQFSMLTAYTDLGSPGQFKIPQIIRPTFASTGSFLPTYSCKALFDYDLQEILNADQSQILSGSSVWDTGMWDSAVWGGGTNTGYRTLGACGLGRMVAIAIRGAAPEQLRLVDLEVMWSAGGFL